MIKEAQAALERRGAPACVSVRVSQRPFVPKYGSRV